MKWMSKSNDRASEKAAISYKPYLYFLLQLLLKYKRIVALIIVILYLYHRLFSASISSDEVESTKKGKKKGYYTNKYYDFDPRWENPPRYNWTELKKMMYTQRSMRNNNTGLRISQIPVTRKMKRVSIMKNGKRSFGCLREGCRGLFIEDLLDRGWSMHFRTAYKNGTKEYKELNYKLTILETDTTQINHMRTTGSEYYNKIFHVYEGATYVSAFEGADIIGGNKGQQLRGKMKLASKHHCSYNDFGIQPSQYRLYVKSECQELVSLGSEGKKRDGLTWLLKPEAGSQGQGITFHTEIEEIMQRHQDMFPCQTRKHIPATSRFLVQQYIERPLLLKQTKFDARVYMFIASSAPWLVFYHSGYLRRSLSPYQPLSRDRKVYLTNTHFQSMKKGFKLSEHIWAFDMLQEYLSNNYLSGRHWVEAVLEPTIKSIALFIFQTARGKMIPRAGSFHIIGLDFMIDDRFGVHFIEANGYPGFTWSLNFDSRSMVEQMIDLALEAGEAPHPFRLMRSGDRYGTFQLIYSEVEDSATLGTPTEDNYNPCEAFADNVALTKAQRNATKESAKLIPVTKMESKGNDKILQKSMDFEEIYKSLPNKIEPGWKYVGGEKGDSLNTRIKFMEENDFRDFKGKECKDYWKLNIEPKSWRLYDKEECTHFESLAGNQEGATKDGPLLLKHVQGKGNGESIRHYASKSDVMKDWEKCKDSEATWIAQERKMNPFLLSMDKVESYSASNSIDDADELNNDQPKTKIPIEEDGDNSDPSSSKLAVSRGKDAKRLTGNIQFDIRAYLLIASIEPYMAFYHPGYLRSSRPILSDDKLYYTVRLNEELITFEELEYYLAAGEFTGAHYLTSVFEPYLTKVCEYIAQSGRKHLLSGNKKNKIGAHHIFAINFILDEEFKIHFVGISGDEDELGFYGFDERISYPVGRNKKVANQIYKMQQTKKELVVELMKSPLTFARMRRGDPYGGFRVVVSEFEEVRFGDAIKYNPCLLFSTSINKNFISPGKLKEAAKLQRFVEKQHSSHMRELRERINKKWASCKYKSSKEAQANCVRETVQQQYKIFLIKEHAQSEPGWVENKIKELLSHRGSAEAGSAT